VSVLGRGDLAPSRSRRRRPSGPLLGLLAVVLLAAIAGGGYFLLSSAGDESGKAGSSCPPATPSGRRVRALTPPAVHLRVLNGTGRNGLAKTTGSLLRARGFPVDAVGNTTGPVTGAPLVRYGVGGRPAAELVALQLPSAVLVADASVRGRVDLVLGSAFTRLRTPAEVAAATRARSTRPATSPRPSPSCR
jgi:hypothetical protein